MFVEIRLLNEEKNGEVHLKPNLMLEVISDQPFTVRRRGSRGGGSHAELQFMISPPLPESLDQIEFSLVPSTIFMEHKIQEIVLDKQVDNQAASSSEVRGDDIRLIARLLNQIHSKSSISQLPTQRDIIKYSINSVGYLTLDEKEMIISILDTLPSKEAFCHGDPNPGNILIQNDGNAVIIDWMNASVGNPEADLAEYIIMIKYAILPFDLPERVSDYFDSIREPLILSMNIRNYPEPPMMKLLHGLYLLQQGNIGRCNFRG